jgi:hypothetical protein
LIKQSILGKWMILKYSLLGNIQDQNQTEFWYHNFSKKATKKEKHLSQKLPSYWPKSVLNLLFSGRRQAEEVFLIRMDQLTIQVNSMICLSITSSCAILEAWERVVQTHLGRRVRHHTPSHLWETSWSVLSSIFLWESEL